MLGEEQIALKEYCELLDAGLEEAKVGVIPQALIRLCGGILKEPVSRTSRRCFYLGPMICIFQENEKLWEVFSQSMTGSCSKNGGVALAPGAKEKRIYPEVLSLSADDKTHPNS